MIEREILIANNRDQSKYRIVTGAETLGQLQNDIANNTNVYKMVGQAWVKNPTPIDVNGLTFTEGITKTQLLTRDSALPTNVQFKGQTTNNLVMLLTNTTKQIRSGAMTRKEAYAIVKEYAVQEIIKERCGRNYTQVPTEDIEAILVGYGYAAAKKAKEVDSNAVLGETREELNNLGRGKEENVITSAEESKENPKGVILPDVKSAPHAATVEWFYDGIKKMASDNLLYAEDVVVLADLTTELAARLMESKPKITASDMDDMLDSIRH